MRRQCTCGVYHDLNALTVPVRVLDEGDVLDGIYFECFKCKTTIFIPSEDARRAFTGGKDK